MNRQEAAGFLSVLLEEYCFESKVIDVKIKRAEKSLKKFWEVARERATFFVLQG